MKHNKLFLVMAATFVAVTGLAHRAQAADTDESLALSRAYDSTSYEAYQRHLGEAEGRIRADGSHQGTTVQVDTNDPRYALSIAIYTRCNAGCRDSHDQYVNGEGETCRVFNTPNCVIVRDIYSSPNTGTVRCDDTYMKDQDNTCLMRNFRRAHEPKDNDVVVLNQQIALQRQMIKDLQDRIDSFLAGRPSRPTNLEDLRDPLMQRANGLSDEIKQIEGQVHMDLIDLQHRYADLSTRYNALVADNARLLADAAERTANAADNSTRSPAPHRSHRNPAHPVHVATANGGRDRSHQGGREQGSQRHHQSHGGGHSDDEGGDRTMGPEAYPLAGWRNHVTEVAPGWMCATDPKYQVVRPYDANINQVLRPCLSTVNSQITKLAEVTPAEAIPASADPIMSDWKLWSGYFPPHVSSADTTAKINEIFNANMIGKHLTLKCRTNHGHGDWHRRRQGFYSWLGYAINFESFRAHAPNCGYTKVEVPDTEPVFEPMGFQPKLAAAAPVVPPPITPAKPPASTPVDQTPAPPSTNASATTDVTDGSVAPDATDAQASLVTGTIDPTLSNDLDEAARKRQALLTVDAGTAAANEKASETPDPDIANLNKAPLSGAAIWNSLRPILIGLSIIVGVIGVFLIIRSIVGRKHDQSQEDSSGSAEEKSPPTGHEMAGPADKTVALKLTPEAQASTQDAPSPEKAKDPPAKEEQPEAQAEAEEELEDDELEEVPDDTVGDPPRSDLPPRGLAPAPQPSPS